MNKNSIIGFVLIGAIMIFYMVYMTPSQEELAKKERKQDSLVRVQRSIDSLRIARAEQQIIQQAAENDEGELPVVSDNANSSDIYAALQSKYAFFAGSATGTDEVFQIETDLAIYEISARGGFIINTILKDYKTYDSLPLELYSRDHNKFGLTFFAQNRAINTADFFFRPADASSNKISIEGNRNKSFSMRLYADKGENEINPDQYIEYLYSFTGDNYMFEMTINIVGLEDKIATNRSSLDLTWTADLLQQEVSVDQTNGSTIYYKYLKDDVDYLSESGDDEEQITTKLKWVSFKQRFFSSTLIAKEAFENGTLITKAPENLPYRRYLKSMSANLEIPINHVGNTSFPLSVYMGPNKFYTLKSYDLELERQIPIGWGFFLLAWINQYIVIPVFDWLGGYGWNYGIVILVLTVLLKIALFPIAYKTYMSSAKMRVLKPEVDEIAKKFPKTEDAMKKQQATMALYKKAGANPASGCIPMLLQMPILIAMFRFFPSSIQLRQQSFLWATDLSSYDSILNLPFTIPFYGNHVSLFTLLMTISTIMYTYLNNQMMGQQSAQLPGMKTMMYLMPIMFLGLFNNYASGLSYYYFLANIFTFGQMFIFRYAIDEDKLRAKIEENKKKPAKKKSGFQKRLEEAARKRGYQK